MSPQSPLGADKKVRPQCSTCGVIGCELAMEDVKGCNVWTRANIAYHLRMFEFNNEGRKFDTDKLRWELLPLDAVEKIVEVMTYGAKKYDDNNWQKVKASRYRGAAGRHRAARYKGEKYDKESGLTHLAHEACNILFMLWKEINEVE